MHLAEPDPSVLARRDGKIVAALTRLVPNTFQPAVTAYDGDALTAYRQSCPRLRSAEDEGAGRCGAALCRGGRRPCWYPVVPVLRCPAVLGQRADAILLGPARMNRTLVDFENAFVVAEPGVTNLAITRAVAASGFFTPPTLPARSLAPWAAMSRRIPGHSLPQICWSHDAQSFGC